jgi:hypothetical protein
MKAADGQPRFTAESTLGKLAKWLRILGFDTRYEQRAPAAAGGAADRIVLTRTRRRYQRLPAGGAILIHSDLPEDQLRQVIAEAGLTREMLAPFSRCIRCNEPIVTAVRSEVRDQVPDYVWETHTDFRRCPRCGRIYWPGTHTTRSLDKIRHLFDNG